MTTSEHTRTPEAEPTLPVAAVARRLGIAPATLRTWDRRYGVGPTGHTTGRHRRYAPADIARLELMQRALLKGAAPAEAAEYALRAALEDLHEPRHADAGGVDLSGITAELHPPIGSGPNATFDDELESVIASTVDAGPDFELGSAASGRHGGRGLRLPGALPTARGLGRAALAMDDTAVQRVITETVAAHGVVAVWDEVLRPVLAAVAGRWAHSGECVEVEHLLHECVLAGMIRATPLVEHPRNPRPVLLACVPGERHSLPLYVLRAELARRHIGTQMLGASLPATALAAAVRRTAPAAVVLWSQLGTSGEVVDQVPRTRQRVRVFACGPGWHDADLPGRAEHLDDLGDAVDRVEAFVTSPRRRSGRKADEDHAVAGSAG